MVKVAFVHDWLVTCRGGEKVLEAMLPLFPEAPIFTLFYNPEAMPESIRSREVFFPSGLNQLRRFRKALLPYLPAAIEALPLFEFDLLISTSSCVAKGAIPGPASKHLCYIHSPMRYIWDQRDEYLDRLPPIPLLRPMIHQFSAGLRQWDVTSANRVDRFIANSRFVQHRVARFYGRKSNVVYPPVDIERFNAAKANRSSPGGGGDYYLVAGAAVSYKRFDLAISACKKLGRRLVVAGSGPEWNALQKMASADIEFVKNPDDKAWEQLIAGAKALLFPGVEDFGITGVEAIAAGTPVIAQRVGGALDFVEEGKSGLFFDGPDVDQLVAAIRIYEESFNCDSAVVAATASKFSRQSFRNGISKAANELMQGS